MSTAWKGPAVLLKEPSFVLWSRLAYRLSMTLLLAVAAVYSPWAWAAVVAWVFAGLMFALAVLAVANVIKNKRVLLRHMGSGSIEWPRSIQEIVLRRPVTWVAGAEIVVVQPPITALPGKTDPRITLSDGTRSIERVPLYGADPQSFVEAANAVLVGRGTVLRFEELPQEPENYEPGSDEPHADPADPTAAE